MGIVAPEADREAVPVRDPELLRLDHQRSAERLRTLTEIRFRLLAFVPTIAGATLAILPARAGPSAFVAVGLVGLPATLGVYLYELRNTEVIREVARRVVLLERGLDPEAPAAPVAAPDEPRAAGGPLVFGVARLTHGRALALVYAAAIAAWAYLIAWGGLALAEVPAADVLGGAVAVAAGLAIVRESERFAAADRSGGSL